ncbi:MAG: family 1 glycosylhydrolase [Anaerolineae bacterium]|nr:family 1 glycosylhydrolase [Anaerolineae bacterium]
MDESLWGFRYSKRFGIVYVDFANDQHRIVKDSARFYPKVISANLVTD